MDRGLVDWLWKDSSKETEEIAVAGSSRQIC